MKLLVKEEEEERKIKIEEKNKLLKKFKKQLIGFGVNKKSILKILKIKIKMSKGNLF